jgi:hypothetical protein
MLGENQTLTLYNAEGDALMDAGGLVLKLVYVTVNGTMVGGRGFECSTTEGKRYTLFPKVSELRRSRECRARAREAAQVQTPPHFDAFSL